MARQIIWVKPVDITVPLHAPNPPATVNDATAQLELTTDQGGAMSQFRPGDDWSVFADDVAGGRVRLQYSRNPPATNATEGVGSTYRFTAFGLSDPNYDVRYRPGTMTVVQA